jgi:hypothetical protein
LFPDDGLERLDERRAGGAKLALVRLRQAAEHPLAGQRQLDEDFTAVLIALAPNDQVSPSKPIEQADHGVMLQLQPIGESPYRRPPIFREPFESEKELVLLRFHPRCATLFLAEDHEATQLMSKLRQGSVVECRAGRSATRRSIHIAIRYI